MLNLYTNYKSSSNTSETNIFLMHPTFYETPCMLHRVIGISRTDIRIERTFLQEGDDVVDFALCTVHLPITADEEFARHFSRSYTL